MIGDHIVKRTPCPVPPPNEENAESALTRQSAAKRGWITAQLLELQELQKNIKIECVPKSLLIGCIQMKIDIARCIKELAECLETTPNKTGIGRFNVKK